MNYNINTWGLKKWSDFLRGNYDFDITTYLVSSLIPYTRIEKEKGVDYVVVDLCDIRQHTAMATQGLKHIVANGFGVWLNFVDTPKGKQTALHDCSEGTLAIGTLKGINRVTLFMENLGGNEDNTVVTAKRDRSGRAERANKSVEESLGGIYEDTQILIDELMVPFMEYANMNGSRGFASKIYQEIKVFIRSCKSRKPNREDYLDYFNKVSAIVNNLNSVPKARSRVKELSTATNIVKTLGKDELVGIVPYFILNIDKITKGRAQEANIYNLSFYLTTTLKLYRTEQGKTANNSTSGRTKPKRYENDSL